MPKIALIGSGSDFGRKFSLDILALPDLADLTISLMDIDEEHLRPVAAVARRAVEVHGLNARIESTLDRRKALEGADYAVASFATGGDAYNGPVYASDIMIPRRYGVDQAVGDTLGPGAIFRTLRTAPVMLDECKDMDELCPDAYLLNYVNPMAMLCWIVNASTTIKTVGLCHSVQGTSMRLANAIGAPYDEVTYLVAGINHMAWFLELKWKGEGAYPLLRERMADPAVVGRDTVRSDLFRHFDHFVTESTNHLSEYVPYYRKSADVREAYQLGTREDNIGQDLISGQRYTERDGRPEKLQRQIAGEEPIELGGSREYAASIIGALETGIPFGFNGNVLNCGIISNLPDECCVEVPCVADNTGIHSTPVGALPTQLAALCQSNIAVQQLTVEAVLERDLRKAYHALLLDPLTAAVCTTSQIRGMFDELVEAQKEFLAYLMA